MAFNIRTPQSVNHLKLPSPEEMAELDRLTIDSGTSSTELMQRAGKAVFAELEHLFLTAASQVHVCILCGNGNNGGDGFVIGQQLLKHKISHSLILISAKKYSSDLIRQAEEFIAAGGKIFLSPDNECELNLKVHGLTEQNLIKTVSISTLIVDALLGTGQKSAPRGEIGNLLKLINQIRSASENVKVAAVDTPSGINAASGRVYSPHLKADATICIELIKRGMLQYPAREVCGNISVVPIGIDTSAPVEFSMITACNSEISDQRPANSHKGNFGKLLIIAGSRDMPGAAFLSAAAGLRSGAGLITLAWPAGLEKPLQYPELMFKTLTDQGQGCFCPEMVKELQPLLDSVDAVVIGPGLGRVPQTEKFVVKLLQNCAKPAVIDADALNILSDSINSLENLKSLLPKVSVLTPHPGEMARVLKLSAAEVQADRYSTARQLSKATSAMVVLKGAGTISYGNDSGWVNSSGNAYMATAGSGDVLAGTIGSLLAQGYQASTAAKGGVFLHGLAGELASQKTGGIISASDIVDCLPSAFSVLAQTTEP